MQSAARSHQSPFEVQNHPCDEIYNLSLLDHSVFAKLESRLTADPSIEQRAISKRMSPC
jgi:hypothetical protein